MMGIVVPYEQSGRTSQKARTRRALVAAAQELLSEGVSPTVEQAADRAEISRTTSYRYFANQRALLVAAYPELEAPSLLAADAPADPVERVGAVAEHYAAQIIRHETALRAQLLLSLDPATGPDDLPLRQGRAITWYEDALAPLGEEIGEAQVRRLAVSIRAGSGIEAFVWLVDVAGLDRDAAAAVLRANAVALAVAGVPTSSSSPTAPRRS
jgi:AcrR family transcriptional regulator